MINFSKNRNTGYFPVYSFKKVVQYSNIQFTGFLFILLISLESFLAAQVSDNSLISQSYGSDLNSKNEPSVKISAQQKDFEPDSADYARASVVANNLLSTTIEKLHILSNIDEEGNAINSFDKIITFDNEVLIVKIQHITLTEVSFLYPFNSKIESINRQKISQILYADNRIDLFTPYDEEKKALLPIQEDRLIVYRREIWERILTTENTDDVAGFTKIGHVSALYEADKVQTNNDYLEKNGMIIIKKRAAKLQADYILITNKSFHRAYGDLPSVKIEGYAYKKQE